MKEELLDDGGMRVPCAICYHMFWPSELNDNACALCRQDAELTKLKANVERLRTALEYASPILERFAQNYHKISILNTKTGNHHCAKEAVLLTSRALEETK